MKSFYNESRGFKFFTKSSEKFILIILALFAFYINLNAQTLESHSSTGSAITKSSILSSIPGVSASLNTTDVDAILVVSTFQMDMNLPSQADRDAGFRLVDSADNTLNSGEFHRSLSNAKQYDYAIGSLVNIFDVSAFSGNRTYSLQHKITSNKELTTTATIAAIALKSGSEQLKSRVNKVINPVGTTANWAELTNSATTTITTTVRGGFYVAASIESVASSSPAVGEWKLQYQKDSSLWTDLTTVIRRSMTNTSNIGCISLVGSLPDGSTAGDYRFRIAHRHTAGAVNTTKANIVALSLGTTDGIFPVFSKIASDSTTSTTPVNAATATMAPSVNTKIFIHAQYEMSASAESNSPVFDLYVDNNMLDGLDQKKYISSNTDYGSGASIGLSNELTADTTYNVSLRHTSTSGVTLNTSNISLNGFALTYNSGPLPIELLYFKAICNKNIVNLKWATASETNNNYFTLERSVDGENFEVIDKITGAGNSNNVLLYSYKDTSSNKAIYYYRLKQTDYDGASQYSNTIAINCIDKTLEDILVYPNPVKNKLRIEKAGYEKNISLEIINAMGAVVYKENFIQETSIQTSNFASGTYLIKLESDNSYKVKKLIIK
jgi:hypothetical protein